MSEEHTQYYPYKSLGNSLRVLREKRRESLAEVSGAVEIEIDKLSNIELGLEKPSEDILLLLMSHFGVKETEATKLWEMAEYGQGGVADSEAAKPSVIVAPNEVRIAYTDMVHAVANEYGVVINFMQELGPGGQPLIVSRVGMSKEHARSLLAVLKQVMEGQAPKALPAPSKSKKKSSKESDRSSSQS